MTKLVQFLFIFCYLGLSGCVSTPESTLIFQDKNIRTAHLATVNQWQIKGKIAFFTDTEKQSANLFWRQDNQQLLLKLTTFLGINVLTLTQENNVYTLKADGNIWQNQDLDELLTQATGLRLPIKSMTEWIKGLKATSTDQITYDQKTQLPTSLETWLNDGFWKIKYQSYMQVDNIQLVQKMTLKHQVMTIKLVIHSWELH